MQFSNFIRFPISHFSYLVDDYLLKMYIKCTFNFYRTYYTSKSNIATKKFQKSTKISPKMLGLSIMVYRYQLLDIILNILYQLIGAYDL